MPWLTLAAVLAAAAAAVAISSRTPDIVLTFGEATRGPVGRQVLTSGTLEPAREVETGAQVSGTVQALLADFNTPVKAGQILAELDPSVYDSELAQAQAKLIQAEADVEQSRVMFDDAGVKAQRARELHVKDLITPGAADAANLAAREAAARLASARAGARAARALLVQARVNRSHTVIRSPIDGIVVSRNVEVGQTLASRLQAPVLFRVADLRRMKMLTDVSEAEVGGVRPGAEVTFEIESLGSRRFTGSVSEVRLQPVLEAGGAGATGTAGAATPAGATGTTGTAPATTTATTGTTTTSAAPAQPGTTSAAPAAPAGAVVSYTAIVDVDNAESRIPPGATAIVMLPTARREGVLRVPNNALAFRPPPAVLASTGQASLTLPDATPPDDPVRGRSGVVWKFERGKFVPVEVRAGVSDDNWTEILSGSLQPGDRLVTAATRAR